MACRNLFVLTLADCKRLTLLCALICVSVSCRTSSIRIPRSQLPLLCVELTSVRDQYLEGHGWPSITDDPLVQADPELQRRFRVITETWNDFVRGQRDARQALSQGRLILLGFGPLNQFEKTYVALMHQEFGIHFIPVDHVVTNINRRIYIHAFNRTVAAKFSSPDDFNAFVDLIKRAVREHSAEKYTYYDPFFIPWRFDPSGGRTIALEPPEAATSP